MCEARGDGPKAGSSAVQSTPRAATMWVARARATRGPMTCGREASGHAVRISGTGATRGLSESPTDTGAGSLGVSQEPGGVKPLQLHPAKSLGSAGLCQDIWAKSLPAREEWSHSSYTPLSRLGPQDYARISAASSGIVHPNMLDVTKILITEHG